MPSDLHAMMQQQQQYMMQPDGDYRRADPMLVSSEGFEIPRSKKGPFYSYEGTAWNLFVRKEVNY